MKYLDVVIMIIILAIAGVLMFVGLTRYQNERNRARVNIEIPSHREVRPANVPLATSTDTAVDESVPDVVPGTKVNN